jgi:hypothetical protein
MNRLYPLIIVISAVLAWLPAAADAQEKPKSYPISLQGDDVFELEKLSIDSNGLTLSGENMTVIPIRCVPGITGAMIIGKGEYSFKPKDAGEIKGVFRAAMLRFNPADQATLLPLEGKESSTDYAVLAMSRHLLDNVFGHCWHSGMDALIPDAGSFVANVYSTTAGDLLISTGPQSNVVHSFTDNKTIYPKK